MILVFFYTANGRILLSSFAAMFMVKLYESVFFD